METVPQRRSRVAAGNVLPKQDVSFGELRQRMLQAARAHDISNTAYRVLDALFSCAGLQPDRRRNGVTVLRHWVREDGCHTLLVWPSEAWLAETVGCHPRTIRRAIRELREAGLIEREQRAGGTPGKRNGANLDSLTRLIVPTPERMPKPRLQLNGSAEELAAAARAGDPKARTMLVDAATALAEWTRDAIDEQTRGMVEGMDRRNRDVLAVIGSTIEGVTVGFYAGLPKAASDGVTLLTGVDEQAAPKASNGEDLRQNGEDKSVRTVRTNLSSPSELSQENSFKPNQPDAIENAQPVAGKDEVGLVRFAEPEADPSDPAYRVESDETAEVDPTLAGLNAEQREAVVHCWPDPERRQAVRDAAATPYTGERSGVERDRFGLRSRDLWRMILKWPERRIDELFMSRQWRRLEELRRVMDGESLEMFEAQPKPDAPAPRSMNGLIERMVSNRVKRETAQALYEQHKQDPERIRQACFDAERGVKEGTCRNPAGLIVSKLNKAIKRASEGYSWAQ